MAIRHALPYLARRSGTHFHIRRADPGVHSATQHEDALVLWLVRWCDSLRRATWCCGRMVYDERQVLGLGPCTWGDYSEVEVARRALRVGTRYGRAQLAQEDSTSGVACWEA